MFLRPAKKIMEKNVRNTGKVREFYERNPVLYDRKSTPTHTEKSLDNFVAKFPISFFFL